MASPTLTRQRIVELQQLAAPGGWCACLLPCNFPAESDERLNYREHVDAVLDAFPGFALPVEQHVFFQFDRMRPEEEIPIFQQNARAWLPDFGLGVWPEQPAPTLWTREEFEDAAPGELRPLMYRIVRVQQDPAASRAAWARMLGTGILLRLGLTQPDRFYEDSLEFYTARIQERSLTSFPFYIPLLRAQSIAAASATEMLDWMCGAEFYLRESAEDGGLLILVRTDAAPLLDRLAAIKTGPVRWLVRRINDEEAGVAL